MEATTLISVEEYLHTNYDPDREYVDGRLIERNLGQQTHSRIQALLVHYFMTHAKEFGTAVFPEQRVQVGSRRFRIPDVTVVLEPVPQEEIFTTPPLLCIEILSPDDRMADMQEKIDDYLAFGVRYIWVINPRNKKGYVVTPAGMVEGKNGSLETDDPRISLPLSLLFA